jgi:hypothetical protein
MGKKELIKKIIESDLIKKWHWFTYHFNFYNLELEHPFAKAIVDSCIKVERFIPGFAFKFIDDLASISGSVKYLPHYEQLIQRLAELFVIQKAVDFNWEEGTVFHLEPFIGDSKKNPEITIDTPKYIIGIEVKCPSLVEHIKKRNENPFQLSARSEQVLEIAKKMHNEKITLPRDNPVKDFLISANEKFASFKEHSLKPFFGALFIVWDDFIYEPITALNSPFSGLLTENSFHKNKEGQPIKFSHLDNIVLLRHMHQLKRATADIPLMDNLNNAMDYTDRNTFPPKVFIPVNNPDKIPQDFVDAFELVPLQGMMGAEYHPSDGIFWT